VRDFFVTYFIMEYESIGKRLGESYSEESRRAGVNRRNRKDRDKWRNETEQESKQIHCIVVNYFVYESSLTENTEYNMIL